MLNIDQSVPNYQHMFDPEAYPSQESFFATVVDVFARVTNNAKTTIFKWGRQLKRSELRAFIESHPMAIKEVEALPFSALEGSNFHVPEGFISTYPEAVEKLDNLYSVLNIIARLKAYNSMLANVRALIKRDPEQAMSAMTVNGEPLLEAAKDLLATSHKEILDTPDTVIATLADEMRAFVSDKAVDSDGTVIVVDKKSNKEVRMSDFKYQFQNMDTLVKSKLTLLAMERALLSIAKAEKLVSQIDKTSSYILKIVHSAVADNQEVSDSFTDAMGKLLQTMAVVVNSFGYATALQTTLEHNYCVSMSGLFALT